MKVKLFFQAPPKGKRGDFSGFCRKSSLPRIFK